jgi:hypothetical protein
MSDQPLSVLGTGVRLAPARGFYFATDHGEVVALDTTRDQYSTLGPGVSQALRWSLDPESMPEPANATVLLEPLIHKGMLTPARPGIDPIELPEPAEAGGVASYLWTPYLSHAAQSGARATLIEVGRALVAIMRADSVLRRGQLGAVLSWLRARLATQPVGSPAAAGADRLVDAHIRARMLYPRHIHCLVGSAALASHAWSLGVDVAFVIGVQKYPFVAHAWIEQDGHVLNDRPDVARRLAPIVSIGRDHESRGT